MQKRPKSVKTDKKCIIFKFKVKNYNDISSIKINKFSNEINYDF